MAARRRRRRVVRRRRRAASGTFVRRKGRTRRIRVHRVRARSHGLRKRRYYKANPVRRRRRRYSSNPFGGRGGLFGGIPPIKDLIFVGAGAVVAPLLLSKTKIAGKLPGTGMVGVLIQAAVGAIAMSFLGKVLKKPALGKQLAFGAAVVPIAGLLASLPAIQKLGAGDLDFGVHGDDDDDVSGGLYNLTGGLYDQLTGPDDELDFGN